MQVQIGSFYKLKWVTSQERYERPNYFGEAPIHAVKNREGDYIMWNGEYLVREPNQLILIVVTEDGHRYTKDIMNDAKRVRGWKRMTKKRREELSETLKDCEFRVVDGEIEGLYQALKKC